MGKPVPFYPEIECHLAPLRPSQAPYDDCDCAICGWARSRVELDAVFAGATFPIRPDSPQWDALLEDAR